MHFKMPLIERGTENETTFVWVVFFNLQIRVRTYR